MDGKGKREGKLLLGQRVTQAVGEEIEKRVREKVLYTENDHMVKYSEAK